MTLPQESSPASLSPSSTPTAAPARAAVAVILLLPLLAGAVVAALVGVDPATTWSKEEVAGAPAVAASDGSELVPARRALGEAAGQAGFLITGTEQLTAGTQQFADASGEITAGFEELAAGSQQLYDGMVQLQAGTGQLGRGATELADSVAQAVDQVQALGAVQGQILTTIDGALEDLRGNNLPDAREAREQLTVMKQQVEAFNIEAQLMGDLNRLRDGTRDLSNQLDVPGYAYHDGVYTATEGARQLRDGIAAARGQVNEAVAGAGELHEGAQRINTMAQSTKDRVDEVARALPPAPGAAADAAADDAAAEEPVATLSPLVAVLAGGMVMLSSTALGAGLHLLRRRRWLIAGSAAVVLTVIAMAPLVLLSSGMTVAAGALSAGIALLSVVVATTFAWGVIHLAGPGAGAALLAVGSAGQIIAVLWSWQQLSTAPLAQWWEALVNVFPLNWSTTAWTVIANQGNSTALAIAAALLGAAAAAGLLGMRLGSSRELAAAN